MEIKDLIKSRRIELGLTMKELGDAIGVSEATVSRYESGQIANMKRSTIIALSKVLNIPTARFIDCDTDSEIRDNTQSTPKQSYVPETIAAHFEGQEFTDEDLSDIARFIDFVASKKRDNP